MGPLVCFCLLSILILFSPPPAAAQDTLWTRTFGGDQGDWAEAVDQTNDGGFIIGGYSQSYGGGSWDVVVIKTDANGDTLWTRVYGGSGSDTASDIQQTTDGGYILSLVDGLGDLLRLNASGDSLWSRDYQIEAHSVRETEDGGYIVTGGADGHCCILKTDTNGNVDWNRSYPSGEFSIGFSVTEATDGGYVVGGSAWSNTGGWDYYVVRTADNGYPLWARTYGRPISEDEGWAICDAGDGGFVVTGLYFGTLKVDAAGDSVWSHYYGEGEIGCAFSVCRTTDDGFLIGGYVDPLGLDDGDYYLVRTDGQGGLRWDRTYNAGYQTVDHGHGVHPVAGGGAIMVGWSNAFGAGDMDIWLVRIDDDVIAIGGEPYASGPLELMVPNPALGAHGIHLTYRIPLAGTVRLGIYDALGRRLDGITRIHPAGGLHYYTWRPQGVAPGIYFVRLESGHWVQRKKVVLLD